MNAPVLVLRLRFATLRVARLASRAVSTVTAGSSRIFFPLACVVLGLWFGAHVIGGHLDRVIRAALTLAAYALIIYGAAVFLRWLQTTRRLVIFDEIVDQTGDDRASLARLLSLRVPVEYERLRSLHRRVEETGPIAAKVSDDESYRSIRATVKAEAVSTFVQGAATPESSVGIGIVKIPLQVIGVLLGRLMQGPRITASLVKDDDDLLIVAQMIGGRGDAQSWQVRVRPASETDAASGEIVHELACRILTTLSDNKQDTWRATSAFCGGIQAYRDYLSAPSEGIRQIHAKRAERKFLETLAADPAFHLAHYNLGVIYSRLGQFHAAKRALLRAVEREPSDPAPYYALARICDAQDLSQSAIELVERVISCSSDTVELAMAHDFKGLVERRLDRLDSAILSRKKAVALAWRALIFAELTSPFHGRQREPSVERELSSITLRNLAIAYAYEGVRLRGRWPEHARGMQRARRWLDCARSTGRFRRAQALIRQALVLTESQADLHFQLGQIYEECGKGDAAVREFERASRADPANCELVAHLAAAWGHSYRSRPSARAQELTHDACRRALEAPSRASAITFEKVAEAYDALGNSERATRVRRMRSVIEHVDSVREDEQALLNLTQEYHEQSRDWATAYALFRLGVLYLETNRLDEALGALEHAVAQLAKHPGEIRELGLEALIARAHRLRGDYDAALSRGEAAVFLDPLSRFERKELGDIYAARDDQRDARSAYEAALLLAPDDADLHWSAGLACWRIADELRGDPLVRELQAAAYHFGQALELYTTRSAKLSTHYWLGRLYKQLGDYERALPHFQKAVMLDEVQTPARLLLAESHLHVGAYEECDQGFHRLLRESRDGPEPHAATVGDSIGDPWPVRELLAWAYIGLASSCNEREVAADAALAYIRRALKEVGRLNADGYETTSLRAACATCKGQTLLKMGLTERAIGALEHAASLELSAETHLYLALAHEWKLHECRTTNVFWETLRRARAHGRLAASSGRLDRSSSELLAGVTARLDRWEERTGVIL